MPEPSKDASVEHFSITHVDEFEPSEMIRVIRDPAIIDADHPPRDFRIEKWKGGRWVQVHSYYMYPMNGEVGAQPITLREVDALKKKLTGRRRQ